MTSAQYLDRIEELLSRLEVLHAEIGRFGWQASDREAFDIVARIERRLLALPQKAAE